MREMLFSWGVTKVTSFALPLLVATVETSALEGGFDDPASGAARAGVSLPGVICADVLVRPAIGARLLTVLVLEVLSDPFPSREKYDKTSRNPPGNDGTPRSPKNLLSSAVQLGQLDLGPDSRQRAQLRIIPRRPIPSGLWTPDVRWPPSIAKCDRSLGVRQQRPRRRKVWVGVQRRRQAVLNRQWLCYGLRLRHTDL